MDAATNALLHAPAPVVTALLDARSDQPQAARQLALRWRTVRRDLGRDGADEATLAAVDAALDGDGVHAGGASAYLVAAGGAVLVLRHLPDPPPGDADLGVVGALPHLLPLVAAEQDAVAHLVVLADRTGADLYGHTGPVGHSAGGALTVAGPDEQVAGSAEDVTRSAPGGFSQRRFQQRAENAWESNAGEAAEAVVAAADELGAELVLVGGDQRAAGFLVDALPERLRPAVRRLDHASRAEGADLDHVADDVRRLVRTAVAERTTAVLATFDEERGQRDRAADGPAAVVAALQTATVDTLLVARHPGERQVWVGPEPTHLGLSADDLRDGMGVTDPVEAPLVDACIRAALGTGATVVVVPASKVRDGVGAVLRHTGTTPAVPGSAP